VALLFWEDAKADDRLILEEVKAPGTVLAIWLAAASAEEQPRTRSRVPRCRTRSSNLARRRS
jgi:hypothetical protein